MEKIIQVKDRFYILADSSLADEQANRVLKHGDTFAIFDTHGGIRPFGFENQGLFHEDTRFLSRSHLLFNGKAPLLLSSGTRRDNALFKVHLTNPDFRDKHGLVLRGTIHIVRTIFLLQGSYFERLHVSNYGQRPLAFSLLWEFSADYADIFELRGLKRKRRGATLASHAAPGSFTLAYRGLDRTVRKTKLSFHPAPASLSDGKAAYRFRLKPKERSDVDITVACLIEGHPVPSLPFTQAFSLKKSVSGHGPGCRIETSNRLFNKWLERSQADLRMLVTETKDGPYPFAGIPWFSTVFGRDGILTAFELLWCDPSIARGVLGHLAATQADRTSPKQDAEPGKILHEMRKSEMAATGEVPFGRYYGSVDATPLFVMLAAQYFERTGDLGFIRKIWSNIERALQWMERQGDPDGDGFIEYRSVSPGGLRNQGWKDSNDSVFHADGKLARSPIALCEVQAYAYAAKMGAAELAEKLEIGPRSKSLLKDAAVLRKKFLRSFWSEKIGSYVSALDGLKKPCEVRSSNALHCLFTGIAHTDHVKKIAEWAMDERSFSGWGIRTLPTSEPRYNPMSYHNGSVWPHDNALAAAGLARYGFKKQAAAILSGLFDASTFFDLHRLPELFCGFERDAEEPTLYPVACDPQAWAAGSVFMILQACLGLSIHAEGRLVILKNPYLPSFIEEVHIRDLKVLDSELDLTLTKTPRGVTAKITRKKGKPRVEMVK